MRGLIICCALSVAVAMPQGYMYSPTGSETTVDVPSDDQKLPEALQKLQFSEVTSNQESAVQLELNEPRIVLPTGGGENVPLPFTTYGILPPLAQPLQKEAIISKQFFIHSAPEEEDEELPPQILTVGQPRKNYNVVFIRAPVKPQRTASIRVIPAVNEDKTIVYVLSKKSEADEIRTHVEELPTTTTKPEVYFIKYKTPEEASHAQEMIQAEYERLGGSTKVSNEGVSPVISSGVGSAEEKAAQPQPTQVAPTSSSTNADSSEELVRLPVSNEYLPPKYYY